MRRIPARNVRLLCLEPQVKEAFDKDKKVVTFSKSSTIGRNVTTQENVQMYFVKEQMTDGDGNKFNMVFEDWDIIGQDTSSLSTVAAVVKQVEGDKYVTSSLVLSFINTCIKRLGGDGSFNLLMTSWSAMFWSML